jgi:vacuolar-type H+-ATPase subunit I/STV1
MMLVVTLFPVASIVSFNVWLAFVLVGLGLCLITWYVEGRIRSARLAIFVLKRDELWKSVQDVREEGKRRYQTLSIRWRLDTVTFKLEDLSCDLSDARIEDLRRRIDNLEQLREEVAQCAAHVPSHDDLVADMNEILGDLEDAAATRQRQLEKANAKHIAELLYRKRLHQNAIATMNESWDAREAQLRRHKALVSRELGDNPAS